MPINWINNKGNKIDPPKDTQYNKRVIISTYKDATGHTWKSGLWLKWWNGNKDREDIIKARRERDKIYYNKHRDEILQKRREHYKANSSV